MPRKIRPRTDWIAINIHDAELLDIDNLWTGEAGAFLEENFTHLDGFQFGLLQDQAGTIARYYRVAKSSDWPKANEVRAALDEGLSLSTKLRDLLRTLDPQSRALLQKAADQTLPAGENLPRHKENRARREQRQRAHVGPARMAVERF